MNPSSPAAPLRILHALFTTQWAGSERYCVDLANRQAALGHAVHVAGKPQACWREGLQAGVQFHPLPLPLWRGPQLAQLARRLGVEVFHGHLSAACKAAAALPDSVASLATLHVGYKPHQHAHLGGLICVNPGQQQQLGGYRGPVRCIPNWLPASPPLAFEPGLRAELGLRPEQFVVGSVGRLHPSKGMDLLLQAFLQEAPAHAVLLLVGEGKEAARLQRQAGGDPRVRLLGQRNDVQRVLAALDLFVSASREESFGLALLEAMAAGLPVLASRAAGPCELLAAQPERLFAVGDATALAAALRAQMQQLNGLSPAQRRTVYALERFEPGTAVAAVIDSYRELRQRTRTRSFPSHVHATAH